MHSLLSNYYCNNHLWFRYRKCKYKLYNHTQQPTHSSYEFHCYGLSITITIVTETINNVNTLYYANDNTLIPNYYNELLMMAG